MKNVTVGKYIPGVSFIHKLNPRVKLAINIIFIVLTFVINSFIILWSLMIVAILFFLVANLRKTQLFKMLIPVFLIGVFLFVVNSFLITGGYGTDAAGYIIKDPATSQAVGHFWKNISWWKFTISDRVVLQTVFILSRIYIMIIITTLLTATTLPIALTRAIEDFLFPLKILLVPTHIIAMIISIALRFIPTLLEEAQRIMKAQASRGVDFKNGNIKSKSKSMLTLIIPLFVSAFSKAEDLGNAMETRGYDPYEKRTRYRSYPIKWYDLFATMIIIGLIVLVALANFNFLPTQTWWF